MSRLALHCLMLVPAGVWFIRLPAWAQSMPTQPVPIQPAKTLYEPNPAVNPLAKNQAQATLAQAQKNLSPQFDTDQSGGKIKQTGDRVTINGITLVLPWAQWNAQGRTVLGVSDVALGALGGIDLLDSQNPALQPIAWRNSPLQNDPQRLELPALATGQARYLDLSPLQTTANWSVTLTSETDKSQILKIQTRSILQISNLLLGRALGNVFSPQDIQWSPGIRWRQQYVRQGGAEFPVIQLRFRLGSQADKVSLAPIWPADEDVAGIAPLAQTVTASKVSAAINGGFFNRNNKTPLGAIRQEGRWISGPILNRGAIAWDDQGKVAMDRLQLNETLIVRSPPTPPSVPDAAVDSRPASDVSESAPSGLSQPSEKASAPRSDRFALISLNSGYLKAGFSRYTQHWGTSYRPLTDNEVLIYVKNGEVVEQREAQLSGEGQFSIPQGNPRLTYLIVARSNRTGAAKLPVGSRLTLQQQAMPPAFLDLPHALGGGPMLIQDGQIVLDASAEGFSQAFQDQRAPRSAIATFANGEVALITVHERIGGKGPALPELAKLLQSMGAEAALNLDGGSSTQLLLGGQLINRNPRGVARVHNGLGLFNHFIQPASEVAPSID